MIAREVGRGRPKRTVERQAILLGEIRCRSWPWARWSDVRAEDDAREEDLVC